MYEFINSEVPMRIPMGSYTNPYFPMWIPTKTHVDFFDRDLIFSL